MTGGSGDMKGPRKMSTETAASQPPDANAVEIGPAPYYHRSDCNMCKKQDGTKTGSALLDVPIPGGYIVEDERFLVEHAPIQSSSAGTVIVEARRHLLDFADMTPTESSELGSLLHRLVPAVKAATGVERVYYLALMERAPHFHLWLIPRRDDSELRGPAYIAQQPPLSATFNDAKTMAERIRGGL
jgi:diadenosine tetraphosphate (Ap4A) HIT family hydrolase